MLFAVVCTLFLNERVYIHIMLGEYTLKGSELQKNPASLTLPPRFHMVSWCRKLTNKKHSICHQLLQLDGMFTFAVKSMFEGKKHEPAN